MNFPCLSVLKFLVLKEGETTYSLRTFPLLAYVKMEGEGEESDDERAFAKNRFG